MHLQLEHVGLSARNSEALAGWYQQVFGAKIVFQNDQKPPAFLLEAWGSWLEIYPSASAVSGKENNLSEGWRHLALRTDSIEAARRELEQRGVVFIDPIKPAGGGGRVLFFKDPEGNLLHLVERSADFQ